MDIRSFFGPASGGGGGGGGSSKPKSSPPGKGGKSNSKHAKGGRATKDAAGSAAKKSPAKRGAKASPNKAIGMMTIDMKPKNKTPQKQTQGKKHGSQPEDDDDDDDEDDCVEVVPEPARKAGTKSPSSQPKTKNKMAADSESDDDVPAAITVVIPSPAETRAAPSSPGARKKRKSEAGTGSRVAAAARGKESPSQVSKKAASATENAGGSAAGKPNGRGRRRGVQKVNYREAEDEDDEGDGGGDDDDEENFSEEDAAEQEDEDSDSDDDDEDDRRGSSSRKRKSTPSSSLTGKTAAVAKIKRAVIDDSSDEDGDDTLNNSKHSSSPPASAFKPRAKLAAGKKSQNDVVELGGTSSDEGDDAEEKDTPPPRKKPTPAARAKPSPASSAGGESAKKNSPGGGSGGGGGFRPPWMGGGRKTPPNEGKKEVPVGSDQCLAGKVFVVSGVLDSLGREAAEDLVKQYGAKVTSSVSSRTTYLLLGSVLDDGRAPEEGSKYKKAQQHMTKVIDEDDLFKMLRDSNPGGNSPPSELKLGSTAAAAGGEKAATATKAAGKPLVANPYAKAVVNPYGAKKPAVGGKAAVVNPYGAAAAAGGGGRASGGKSPAKVASALGVAHSSAPGQMWVDKYKPKTSSEVIGHAGQVKKLRVWLENWDRWHLGNTGVKPPTGKDNPGARAALLSGVPGVGKSSTATLVAKEMGYHVMELNASDTRNKSSLSTELDSVIGNQVLAFIPGGSGGGGSKGGGFTKQLVVMDEVDGMGGSDRGGIQELILLIKKSKVPIMAICNDRQHQKIRSLVNHCYDLRFARPQKATIAKRVKAIANMEGMDVDDNAAEMLVEANGNDIRQVLHAMQMWSRKSSKMTYMSLKGGLSSIEKDKVQRCGPFDAARLILGSAARTPLRERFEAFFTDYSLLPLLVQQNYLSSLMRIDPKTKMEVVASAAAAVSDADIISGKMRGDVQNWSLLPTQAAMNVRVGSIGGGNLGFPEFPRWLGNYSRENKRRRLLGELCTHLNAAISGGTEAIRLSYMHFLLAVLTKPLRVHGADGVRECVDLLEEYGLSRDDLLEVMPEFQLSTKGMKRPPPDVFASLDSKTKSALTRYYNSLSHKSQALVETIQAPKRSKRRRAPPKSLAMAEEDEDEDDENGDEEDDDDDDDLWVFKKKGKSRASPASGKGKTAAKPRAKKGRK